MATSATATSSRNSSLQPETFERYAALKAEATRRHFRHRARTDLHWLLVHGLNRKDCDNDWVRARCREVQDDPDGYLDLWAREHYKSTIITFALTIQNILNNPDITIGIFSHTRPIAKAFLKQIKREFETNDKLIEHFDDIFYANPARDSPKWSEDEGIIVKRNSNPKEATVEAWGVVDGQPTSKHFQVMVFDDVVTKESVSNDEMIKKTTESLSLSYNLGTQHGARRFIGTRYHFNDTYREVIARGTAIPRIYAATENGKVEGKPVFLSRKKLTQKRADMGPYVFGCQMLQNPTADQTQGFKLEWLRYAAASIKGQNIVILVDAASAKKKTSDYTAMWALGLGPDRKVYVHDMLRDRLSLTQRGETLMAWHRKWKPMVVGYEQYGMMGDIEHIQYLMEQENYRFDIKPLGGTMPKVDRIRRLIPWFEKGRIYLHPKLVKTNYEHRDVDLTKAFVDEEYLAFPVAVHDDMLDALARFLDEDLPIAWPMLVDEEEDELVLEQGRNPITGY